jgi:hypothetical protein
LSKKSGSDSSRDDKKDYIEGIRQLDDILEEYRPFCLAFNGKESRAQYLKYHGVKYWRGKYIEYGKQQPYTYDKTNVFVLPSTASASPQGIIQKTDNKKYWYELAYYVKNNI